MSIIIRLQNLPWAADSGDIRRYFAGLSIPEGGVHIVGGEMGDAFIAFSTDEDARLAMAKDGGKIHEMQIKLLLSSRQEMGRVIERARQQNVANQTAAIVPPLPPPPFPNLQQIQQPLRTATPPENDRRSRRSPTPPRRRSRERDSRDSRDSRDRRRSPDSRRSSSKRDRSRSPSRSSRSSNRDSDSRDRRSDRSKRDDRRHSSDDSSKHSHDRHSDRHRYSDADHNSSRSQSQSFPESTQNSSSHPLHNYQDSNIKSNNSYPLNNANTSKDYPSSSNTSNMSNYPYGNSSNASAPKDYPYYNVPDKIPLPQSNAFGMDKNNTPMMVNQVSSALPNSYLPQTTLHSMSIEKFAVSEKTQAPTVSANISQERRKKSRFDSEPDRNSRFEGEHDKKTRFELEPEKASRFEAEPKVPLQPPFFQMPEVLQKLGVHLNLQKIDNTSSTEEKLISHNIPVEKQISAPNFMQAKQIIPPNFITEKQLTPQSFMGDRQMISQNFIQEKQMVTPSFMQEKQIAPQSFNHEKQMAPQSFMQGKQMVPQNFMQQTQTVPQRFMEEKQMAPQSFMQEKQMIPQNFMQQTQTVPQRFMEEKQIAPQHRMEDKHMTPQRLMQEKQMMPPSFMQEKQMMPPSFMQEKQMVPQNFMQERQMAPPSFIQEKHIAPERFMSEKEIAPQRFMDEKQMVPQRFMQEKQMAPQRFVEERQMGPQRFIEEKKMGPQRFMEEKQMGPQRFMEEKQMGHQRFIEEKQMGSQRFMEEKQIGPQRFIEEKPMGHQRFMEEKQTGYQHFREEKQMGPQRFMEEKQTGHQRFMEETQMGPQRFLEEKQTGQRSMEEKQMSHQRFMEEKQTGHQRFMEEKQMGPQRFMEEKQTGHQRFMEDKQMRSQRYTQEKQTSPQSYSQNQRITSQPTPSQNYMPEKNVTPHNYMLDKQAASHNYMSDKSISRHNYMSDKSVNSRNYILDKPSKSSSSEMPASSQNYMQRNKNSQSNMQEKQDKPQSYMPENADKWSKSKISPKDEKLNISKPDKAIQHRNTPQTQPINETVPMDIDPPEEDTEINSSIKTDNSVPKPLIPTPESNLPLRKDNEAKITSPAKSKTIPDSTEKRAVKTLAVEVKNVPFDVKPEDFYNLFQNIKLSQSGVCIQTNNQKAEKAFLRFSNIRETEQVINSQPHVIRNSQLEITPCPVSVFDTAFEAQSTKLRSKMKSGEDDLILQLKGLPFQCTEHDVVRFFDGLRILDIFVESLSDGRCSGVGFVEFASMKDFKEALTFEGKSIGHRYININVSSKENLEYCRRENNLPSAKPSRGPQFRRPPTPPVAEQFAGPPEAMNHSEGEFINDQGVQPPINNPPAPVTLVRGNFCIAIRGLPKSVTNVNLGNFFRDMDVCPLAIHIIVDIDGPTGEAYIEVAMQREVDIAISNSGKPFNNCCVQIVSFPMEELDELIGRPPPPLAGRPAPPSTPSVPLLRTPLINSDHPPRRPFLPRGSSGDIYPDRGPNEHTRGSGPMHYGRPRMPRMRPPFERPTRPPFGRMRGPRLDEPRDHDSQLHGFGAPGCVVSINNLHFSAGLEELLVFFRDYRLTKDNIIRRYNENQQPTGEARVSFESPREARRAVQELNTKPIMGRSLHLSIL